jgi:HNH endonuclease/AP2 domain
VTKSRRIGAIITQDGLKEIFRFAPDEGQFYWLTTRSGVRSEGLGYPAGQLRPNGYRIITIEGRRYPAHRLVWLYVNGEWPLYEIDHIDGDASNNRIENLRDCTRLQNAKNRPTNKNNIAGIKGVCRRPQAKKRPWRATIRLNRRCVHLGYFNTPEEAKSAYDAAATAFFGEFVREGA